MSSITKTGSSDSGIWWNLPLIMAVDIIWKYSAQIQRLHIPMSLIARRVVYILEAKCLKTRNCGQCVEVERTYSN